MNPLRSRPPSALVRPSGCGKPNANAEITSTTDNPVLPARAHDPSAVDRGSKPKALRDLARSSRNAAAETNQLLLFVGSTDWLSNANVTSLEHGMSAAWCAGSIERMSAR
jgi:hypothetical protein